MVYISLTKFTKQSWCFLLSFSFTLKNYDPVIMNSEKTLIRWCNFQSCECRAWCAIHVVTWNYFWSRVCKVYWQVWRRIGIFSDFWVGPKKLHIASSFTSIEIIARIKKQFVKSHQSKLLENGNISVTIWVYRTKPKKCIFVWIPLTWVFALYLLHFLCNILLFLL